jgi:adenine deaminase
MTGRLKQRILAAQGRVPCDLAIRGARYLDVFACTWREGDVGVFDGHVVALEAGVPAARAIDGRGKYVVPGFVDAHVHLESSLMAAERFEQSVLPCGTTTAICDPHEIANVLGVAGLRYFLEAAATLSMDLRVMLSSCVPATSFETNGAGVLGARELAPLASHPKALGLAEVMNVPGVLEGDPGVLEKIEAFSGRPLDGHAPLVRGAALSGYAAAGISTCHESSELAEAEEKLTKGIACWIREGSVAKDLAALAPLLTMATSTSVGFCTDDRNPLDIAHEGHLDHLVRSAIRLGVAEEVAYRAASWSVARHYGLARVGAVAPGYRADLVLLDDARTCAVRDVVRGGRLVSEMSLGSVRHDTAHLRGTVRASAPAIADLEGPTGRVHVIGVRAGRILTDRSVEASDAPGVSKLTVLERHGRGGKPANAYVRGFGTLRGAIASSVGHDSHNLIVVGDRASDMRAALAALIDSQGGFVVVHDGAVLAHLALPIAGLMTLEEPRSIADALERLRAASRAIGCELPEPFLQLAFLSLPVIPSLKLTDKGLMDVDAFRIIDVRAA